MDLALLVLPDFIIKTMFKGILPQTIFYRSNLIFRVIMGCGKARFGQKGQKTSNIENFGLKVFSLGPRGKPHGPRGRPQ